MNNINIPPILHRFLEQSGYSQQQQQYPPPQHEPQAQSRPPTGIYAYEITSPKDMEYIAPDTSGRAQIFICAPEKRIYIARYNHASQKPDYEAYISEGDVKLFQPQGADNSQVIEALMLVATKMDAIFGDVQTLKENTTKKPRTKKAAEPNTEQMEVDA